jgi:hypothetical protein
MRRSVKSKFYINWEVGSLRKSVNKPLGEKLGGFVGVLVIIMARIVSSQRAKRARILYVIGGGLYEV